MVDHAVPVICRHKQIHLWWRLRIRESIFHLSLQHILAHSSLSSCFLLVKRLLRSNLSMRAFFLVGYLSSIRCMINAEALILGKHTKVCRRLSHFITFAADPKQPRFGRELILIKYSACLNLFVESKLDLLRAPILLSLSECDALFFSTRLILRGSCNDFFFVLLGGQKELDLANVAWYVSGEILAEFRMLGSIRVMVLGTSPRVILDFKNLNLPEFSSDGNQAVVLLNVVHVNVEDVWIKLALTCCEEVLGCIIYFDGEPSLAIRFQVDFIDVQLGIVAWHDQVVIVIELKLCQNKFKSYYISHLEGRVLDHLSVALVHVSIHMKVQRKDSVLSIFVVKIGVLIGNYPHIGSGLSLWIDWRFCRWRGPQFLWDWFASQIESLAWDMIETFRIVKNTYLPNLLWGSCTSSQITSPDSSSLPLKV